MFNNPFEHDNESSSTVFRDVIFLALAGFVAITLIIIPHINPPIASKNDEMPLPGNMLVEMFWNDKYNIDIDLWVQAPNDTIVGFSSTSGKLFNLLRDDMGYYNDSTGRNYEIAVTRGLVPGEYTINVMYYNASYVTYSESPPKGAPIDVKVVISTKKEDDGDMIKILDTVVQLYYVKNEVTVANFRLNNERDIVVDSVNNIFRKLSSKDAARYSN